VVGRTAVINGRNMTITGVMPGWFHFGGDRDTELWMPSGLSPQELANRGSHFLTVYGRLKPGVTVQQADAEMKSIQTEINRTDPNNTDPRMSASVESLRDALVGDMGPALWILMTAAGTVLLIACSNVASLLLARATRRRHEMAVRTSLGATGWQLANVVLYETCALAAAGAALGIGLAFLSRRLLENFVPAALKGTVSIEIDPRILVFAIAISAAAALFAALTPIWQTLRNPLASVLRQDSRSGASKASVRMRSALVVGEIALTVTLLAGAGLMVRSFLVIWNTGLGFDAEHLMVARVSVPIARYQSKELRDRFYNSMVQKVRAAPGVAAADFASAPPFYSTGNSMGYALEGRTPEGKWENGDMLTRVSTSGYMETLGARMVSGRSFQADDRAGMPDVAIVNETFARTFFPNSSAVGHRISLSDRDGFARRWRTIVGVVKEIRERGYDPAPKPVTYITTEQTDNFSPNQLVVRAKSGSGLQLVNAIRRAVSEVDPNQPIGVVRTFDEILALDQASRRQQLFLLSLFASLSLTMACFGIYAILAYSVELRRQEIGVRMALGADRASVFRIITGDGLKLTALGAVLGLLAAAAGGRLIRASLYGIEPLDPMTLASVCGVLTLVSLLACSVPSLRAARTNPSAAMRDQ
jgi:predicted permease